MIQLIIERLSECTKVDEIILATGDGPENEILARFVVQLGVNVYRGSENDVLDRYRAAARAYGLTEIVRATGDNPFVDAEECDRLIDFRRIHDLDYAAATPSCGGGLPDGVGVEIMTRDALERSWREGRDAHHREHINEYIHEHPELFTQDTLTTPTVKNAPSIFLTVDTEDEFLFAESLLVQWQSEGYTGSPNTPWLINAVLGKG